MEFLQGRALTNAIGNLNIHDTYTNALCKFGLELEEIAEQVIKNYNLYMKLKEHRPAVSYAKIQFYYKEWEQQMLNSLHHYFVMHRDFKSC